MNCADCQHENSANARFCESCGARLQRMCVDCGEPLPPAARFCSQCGRFVAEAGAKALSSPAASPQDLPLAPSDGERRQITAMFCDLVDSTELSERLDGEDFRDLIATYHETCSAAVKRFDGYVAQLLGDGVLAYFGFPRAHEDDAQRAIRAGLEIQSALAAANLSRSAAALPQVFARIGIHSGPVVVSRLGGDGRHEMLALGETVNVAARLQAVASPGGLVVTDATLRLAPGVFVTRDLGTPVLKGISLPVRVHAVERALGSAARRVGFPKAPLLGRDHELDMLLARWERALDGQGQVVAVSGEPGIGKSRLLADFRERIASAPHSAIELYCSPYVAGSAFQPSVEAFETGLGFEESDEPEARLAKLEQGMAQLPGVELTDVVPYLAALLNLPPSPRFPLEHMSVDVQRERTLQALLAPLLAMERIQPVVIVFEDLHWADQSSLELIGRLIDQTPTLRMMLVLTYRPSFAPPWPLTRSFVTPLSLSRLGRRAIRALIEACAGRALPDRVLEDIAARADGVPLFAEELARAVVASAVVTESGAAYEPFGQHEDISIPTTLQGSLMARLDRLSQARPVAQLGSILGREFSFGLIEAVSDLDASSLRSGLDQLVAADVLYVRGSPPVASYTFKHVLLQDTAYASQLKSRRRELHARAAIALEERFPMRVAAEPQVVARHCSEGGLTARAIAHFAIAGQQAIARLANPEAADHYEQALALLATLPEDTARNQQELTLRLALAGPLSARGYDHPSVLANFARAEALCEGLGSGPDRLPGLVSLAVLHQARGDLARAGRWARELLAVADGLGLAPLQLAAHAMLGAVTAGFGSIPDSCDHYARVYSIASSHVIPPPVAAFDLDIASGLSGGYAISLVLAGRPDQAFLELDRGLTRAREIGHPHTLALALSTGVVAAHLSEDHDRLLALSEECLQVTRGRGFVQNEAIAVAFGGWARVMLGDDSGAAAFDTGLSRLHDSGAVGGVHQFYVAATEIAMKRSRFDEARARLANLAGWVDRLGMKTIAANVPMLDAELLLAERGDPFEAERLLLESIEGWRTVFRSPWMELRSALRLAEIAPRTGNLKRERERLAALVGEFREGFDTKRLREAKRLLVSLDS